jgi:hypothetical protein
MTKARLPRLLLIASVVALVRCSPDGPIEPRGAAPGALTLVLRSPNGAEGAALLDIAGTYVTGVGADGSAVYSHPDGDRLRIAIARAQPGELRAIVALSDTTRPLDARVVQVAGPTNALRGSLAGYTVEVRR